MISAMLRAQAGNPRERAASWKGLGRARDQGGPGMWSAGRMGMTMAVT